MGIKLSLFLALVLMFIVVGVGFDQGRARNTEPLSSNVTIDNNPPMPGQYYYRRYHHRHHRHHRRHGYSYYRR